MPWILSAAFLVVETLAVASAVHALFTVRTAQGTIAWVIGLIAFPWLGLPLYWIFGSRWFDAHSNAMKLALTKHGAKIHEVRAEMKPFQVRRSEIQPARVGDLAAVAREQFLRGNNLDLLIDGAATFDAILGELANAKNAFSSNSTSCARTASDCASWKPLRLERPRGWRSVFFLTSWEAIP
jgi:cardiolipin synthase